MPVERSFSDAEGNEDTSWYTSFAAGVGSGVIKTVEGAFSLTAELIDLGVGTNAAAGVENYFDKINIFEDTAEANAAGKISETLVQIGIPGTLGFKLASNAVKAKKLGKYVNPKSKNILRAKEKADALNKGLGKRKFVAGVLGGAAGETFVADVEDIGTFGDMFGAPTSLDLEERADPSEDAFRKLANRLKFGSESLFITPVVAGVGKGAKALATRGKDLAFSNSKIDRALDKLAGAFRPSGNLGKELFDAEQIKEGLKASDKIFAKEIVDDITKIADGIYPKAEAFFSKSGTAEQKEFLKQVNNILFEGDLKKNVIGKDVDALVKNLKLKNISPGTSQEIINNLNRGRQKFRDLFDILDRTNPATAGKDIVKFKNLLKDRVQNWLGTTYKIFEDKGITGFKAYKPTDEAYERAVNIFRRQFKREAGDTKPLINSETGLPAPKKGEAGYMQPVKKGSFVPQGDDYLQQARDEVNGLIKQVQVKKTPGPLPDFQYQSKTAADGLATKSFTKQIQKAKVGRRESKAFRELFGEVQDPRYSLYNGITNLSSIARTSQYLSSVAEQNAKIQSTRDPITGQFGRGFFWDKDKARAAVNQAETGIELVKVDKIISQLPGGNKLVNPLAGKYTTKAIAEALESANGIASGLQGFVKGGQQDASMAAASWMWRNLLLLPKAGSQMAKTILSVPTHLRNVLSAFGFSGANGILFENPKVVAEAFRDGIGMSGLLKLGPKDPKFREAYRELVELGVVNSQVQIGDLAGVFKDIRGGLDVHNVDSFLSPMMKRLKKVKEFAQGKYVAEDDTFKIANFMVEKYRRKNVYRGLEKYKGLSDADLDQVVKQEAADIVKNTVPNYGYVGSIVKTARMLPIGNFMSFPSEMLRTSTNIVELGLKEMRHSKKTIGSNVGPLVYEAGKGFVANDNPLYAIGAKRLIGMASFTTGVPIALTEGAKALYNVTDEELAALRRFVPEWSKNSTLIPIRDEETGDLRYIDWSHSNAYDLVARPFRTVFNNVMEGQQTDQQILQGMVRGATEAGAEIMNPFISESIWTEAASDLTIRGGRTKDGRQLYTDQTPAGDRVALTFLHLGKALSPSIGAFTRLGQALTETPTKRGEALEIGPELGGIFGLRAIKIDPERSMGFKIGDFQRGIRNSRREFTGGFFGILKGGSIDSKDVINKYIASNRARFNVMQNMYKDIKAAETLGVSRSVLSNQFQERQVSQTAFNALNRGRFIPYYPSDDILRRFSDIARDLGEPNAYVSARPDILDIRSDLLRTGLDQKFAVGGHVIGPQLNRALKESIPILQDINKQMRQLSLDDEFDINVTDYIVEEEIATPPLPPQPQPNQKVVMPPNPLQPINDGLTPTERALLSPEEQTMRLKQRGFIT